jgi:predicted O-methyltransferase YrrM|tara:strand:- start:224 stop:802 length:579 start_codon:yes stop_codon:yes gene_type:complete
VKHTLRFNPPKEWKAPNESNFHFLGLCELLDILKVNLNIEDELKMVEIGSHMGESTFMFAASQIFKSINCIDPFKGNEEALAILRRSWKQVKEEFKINTRYFDNIVLHEDYSFEVVKQFKDKSLDFVYIDGDHTYSSIKRDIILFQPKLKSRGIIAGHDYNLPCVEVKKAVDEIYGKPDLITKDGSWVKFIS